jgi:O-methyltransferase involved in polyketide biosynthesis
MSVAKDSPRQSTKKRVTLTGVSETALLTLNARAGEARRADAVIDDPMAIALVDSIHFDFAKFGTSHQGIALRARAFDIQTQSYLRKHPSATVVALAEGLQTSFWRLEAAIPDSQFRWLTVDLPPIVDVRTRLLPPSPRVSVCAQSALDYSWMDTVDPAGGVVITAEGLLMYLQPEQALGLITQCAKRFPGGQMLFDLPPGLVFQGEPLRRLADLAALQGAADAVQPVRRTGRRPGEHGAGYSRGPRYATATGSRHGIQRRGLVCLPRTVVRRAASVLDAAGVRLRQP